ncbi:MAG TPA: BolA family protein [Denitromonas sp.]|uniref:BolA family protein n=1 Tax=Denitromonas sp. TaxID=2734609 RepID=UPI001D934C83|nr:BolA family transcriptional regulator [Rhodocyclaceae bacterium]MCP5220782.1 BolA family transcriptional regulator [Zoogloeaceae bacterium]HPR05584.1 BolA family protein [Denitromonas sp.]HQU87772.1 BolA family protein [Denitromonas sp.]HQV14103.1 BolA family protein [Denitromonas sp.]
MSNTLEQIEARLTAALAPASLHIDDDSAQHAGHAGARDGGGHYRVDIVSAAFAGKNTMARHRLIYAALGDLMPRAIHALSIRASAPEEL